jgi:type I restriction enzyme M protein
MNMILHGIESPNIIHQNTLETNIQEIQNKDRVDVILANPPFGGKEKTNIQENFPIKTGETAYLFLQHFIKKLKVGGRCGVVIKNTFLSNTDNASIALRKQLLEDCNLFAILDLPSGAFLGTGVKTVVLFFEKGEPTKKLWYYQLNVGRSLGKTNSLNENDLELFIKLAKSQKLSDNSWSLDIKKVNTSTFDISVKNPNVVELKDKRTPDEIILEIENLDKDLTKTLKKIKELI